MAVKEAAVTENQEVPLFDFSPMSWGDAKAITRAQGLVKKATDTGDSELLGQAFDAIQIHLSKCVTFVPPDWIVAGDEALNWSDPSSFDRLKSHRMGDLMKAMEDAQRSENAGKN